MRKTLSDDELFAVVVALGDIQDRMGEATAARSQYLEALALVATNDGALYARALLHLVVGDTNGYRAVRKRIGPGAEEWLRGRGGLRCRILTDGALHCEG